nr:transposase [Burkholderia sp. Ac-20384]
MPTSRSRLRREESQANPKPDAPSGRCHVGGASRECAAAVAAEAVRTASRVRDHLLDSGIVFADEATVQVLKEPGRTPQTRSFMWAQMNGSGPPVRLFRYAPGCGKQHWAGLWTGIRRGAVFVTNSYEPYNAIANANLTMSRFHVQQEV